MHHGEKLNSITHMLGAVVALAGLVVLIVAASLKGDVWRIVSFSIYGTSLFLLYLFSTIYHSSKGSVKALFKKLDHIGIYLLDSRDLYPFRTRQSQWCMGLVVIWGNMGAGNNWDIT